MAEILNVGWEDSSLTPLAYNYGGGISTGWASKGTKSLYFYEGDDHCMGKFVLTGDPSEIYFQMSFKPGNSTAYGGLFALVDADGNENHHVCGEMTSAGALHMRVRDTLSAEGWELGVGGSFNRSSGNVLDVHVKVHATEGIAQAKVNGVQVINFAGNTKFHASSGIHMLQIANCRTFNLNRVYLWGWYDDIHVDTAHWVGQVMSSRGGMSGLSGLSGMHL